MGNLKTLSFLSVEILNFPKRMTKNKENLPDAKIMCGESLVEGGDALGLDGLDQAVGRALVERATLVKHSCGDDIKGIHDDAEEESRDQAAESVAEGAIL